MTLTGERFSAAEAMAAGLLSAVVPDATTLDQWVTERTDEIRKSAPGAVGATKELLRSLRGRLGGRPGPGGDALGRVVCRRRGCRGYDCLLGEAPSPLGHDLMSGR